jgi:predicted enzyme related to lactoylglutathione lyase
VAFYRRLGLSVPDTDAAFPIHHRAAQVPGGVDLHFDSTEFARYAIVEDPDGNAVGVMSPVDPARRSDAGFP